MKMKMELAWTHAENHCISTTADGGSTGGDRYLHLRGPKWMESEKRSGVQRQAPVVGL